jgi:hypothetical protein
VAGHSSRRKSSKNSVCLYDTNTLSQWDQLFVNLEASVLKPDNNIPGSAIYRLALRLKHWFFAGGPKGAQATATMFILIETVKVNGLKPYQYFRHVLWKSEKNQLVYPVVFLPLKPNVIPNGLLNSTYSGNMVTPSPKVNAGRSFLAFRKNIKL